MAGDDLPPIFQSTFRTRFEFSRAASSPLSRPPGHPVPAVSLIIKGNPPNISHLSDVDPQIVSLQKNILYLQHQQTETLEKLHAEMDFLKRENKELKYKLTMDSSKGGKKGATSNRNAKSPFQLHSGFYVDELLEDSLFQDQASREVNESPRSVQLNHRGELTGLRKTVLEPVRVNSNPIPIPIPSDLPRPSTRQECEAVIQELSTVNRLQTQEIARLKELLSDIILSKKITREHQILSKAYLANEPCPGPSLPGVLVPGLKQHFGSNAAKRQNRLLSSHQHHIQRAFR
ncbi:coiled-coil domain-containing protein 74B isoform X2 [Poecilia reticulata]|uniref:coiled-coil domain-containing protein 74B isoform X2 n=1 Tax=Poecilia reticulata TaxID=8081 RepID=UPI0007EB342C|nr:PREDICTED: coiled-coil domain-containing protein 74B-like isoform X2 [Poecilia reticulata]